MLVAAQCGHADIVSLLLGTSGCKVDTALHDGATPLFVAAQNGHFPVARLLLKRGAEVDAKREVSVICYVCCT